MVFFFFLRCRSRDCYSFGHTHHFICYCICFFFVRIVRRTYSEFWLYRLAKKSRAFFGTKETVFTCLTEKASSACCCFLLYSRSTLYHFIGRCKHGVYF